MRTLSALTLVLLACGCSDRSDAPDGYDAPAPDAMRGSDVVVLRIPRGGGLARAYAYPGLDSVVWRSSSRVPALERVLAFDAAAGSLVYVRRDSLPGRLDLRLGATERASATRLAALASSDGSAIYGVREDGTILRLTPTATWPYESPASARMVLPQVDGSIVVVADSGARTVLWRLRPPEPDILARAVLPRAKPGLVSQAGDRIYAASDSGLVGARVRDLSRVPTIRIRGRVSALTPTPSGDRLYVVTDTAPELTVVDRYREEVAGTIRLPGPATRLRMDPFGRFLLVRAGNTDSAYVITIATDSVIGTVPTAWRADLPAVAPDGAIALASGKDVRIVEGESLRARRTITGGAADVWHILLWNGFRPRAAGIDSPVSFPVAARDTAALEDTDFAAERPAVPGDSQIWLPAPVVSARDEQSSATDTRLSRRDTAANRSAGFYVSFAALLAEDRARALAAEITVEGRAARVVSAMSAGTMLHRVVLGPYATRAAAERAAQQTGRDFWIYEGLP